VTEADTPNTLERAPALASQAYVYEKLLGVEFGTDAAYRQCFWLLVAPSRYWMRGALTEDQVVQLGRAAHDRFVETESTCASDYCDIGSDVQPALRGDVRQ